MKNKKGMGIGILIASIVWFVSWLWLFKFEWIVLGICLFAFAFGVGLILEE